MKLIRKAFILLLGITLLSAGVIATSGDDPNAHIKAVFIYNFTKYVEWPKSYKEGNFVITILGNSSGLLSELNTMAGNKTVGTQRFEINSRTSLENLPSKCHILFIPGNAEIKLPEVIAKLKGKNTLIIAEKAGSTKQGAAINFVVMDNKQKFEINKTNAEKYELKISSTLTSLAVNKE